MKSKNAIFSKTATQRAAKIFACAIVALSFASPSFAGDNSFWGTGIGAALGGLAGAQFGKGSGKLATTGLGVFMGGAIGNSVGSSMDRVDTMSSRGYGYAPTYVAPSYHTYQPNYVAPPTQVYTQRRHVVYVQPETVEYREAVPMYATGGYLGGEPQQPVTQRSSRYCREFTQKVKVGGRVQESYGTACLQPDGSWQIEP